MRHEVHFRRRHRHVPSIHSWGLRCETVCEIPARTILLLTLMFFRPPHRFAACISLPFATPAISQGQCCSVLANSTRCSVRHDAAANVDAAAAGGDGRGERCCRRLVQTMHELKCDDMTREPADRLTGTYGGIQRSSSSARMSRARRAKMPRGVNPEEV